MKTKLLLLATLTGSIINAALAQEAKLQGDAGLGFSSDVFFRGQTVSQEALSAKLGLDFVLAGFNSFVDFSTSQSMEVGDDKYDISAGMTASLFGDSLSIAGGLLHYELEAGPSELEAFVSGTFDTLLSPSVSVYRNLDESLYTYAFSVGHSFDLDLVSLGLSAGAGLTDLTANDGVEYYEISATASRSITDSATAFANVSYNDSEIQADSDVFWGAGIKVKF